MALKHLISASVFAILSVVCQTRVEAGKCDQPSLTCCNCEFKVFPCLQTACGRVEEFSDLEGFCYIRGEEECNGTEFRQGCVGETGCALCVLDTSICLEKPVCSDANGVCVQNLTDCDRLINERHCHGDGCACCKDGCVREDKCKELDGYCLLKDQKHLCEGTQFNLGCVGKDCFCCVPDTSLCIEKLGCLNANGTCLKEPDWTDCDTEIDSYFCLGDDCACCREKECIRSDACLNAGGYCFRKKTDDSKTHVCTGTESTEDCGGADCVCCIPA
ncbi:protein psiB-like [Palaemon carinicauda]|uniref:protein psiB-like n=1 Tax=Palaemon carinicauda TaxID=392227 RepID=UPI0035B65F6C